MDRSVWVATVVFVALAIVGIFLAMSPTSIAGTASDPEGVRVIGGALLAGGLATFLVVILEWDYHRRRS